MDASLLAGLVHVWTLQEPTGSARNDTVGVVHMADNNSVSRVTGWVYPFAAGFIRDQLQHLSAADHTSLDFTTTGFTYSFWVKVRDSNTNYANQTIAKGDWSDSTKHEYAFELVGVSNPGLPAISVWSNVGDARAYSTDGTPIPSSWHMVTVAADPADDSIKVWIDNEAAKTATSSSPIPVHAADPLYFGRLHTSGVSHPSPLPEFDEYGSLSLGPVYCWNRVLSDNDVRVLLWNGGNGVRY